MSTYPRMGTTMATEQVGRRMNISLVVQWNSQWGAFGWTNGFKIESFGYLVARYHCYQEGKHRQRRRQRRFTLNEDSRMRILYSRINRIIIRFSWTVPHYYLYALRKVRLIWLWSSADFYNGPPLRSVVESLRTKIICHSMRSNSLSKKKSMLPIRLVSGNQPVLNRLEPRDWNER